ncbi:MAG: hypothetical protein WBP81_06650 [Solirubrobacteraceae bacterium]
MYRELAKGALKRAVEDLRVRAAELAEQKKRDRESGASRADNPAVDAERQRDAQLRELADQAHGVNLDLGSDLLMSLSAVDPLDMNVAPEGAGVAAATSGAPAGNAVEPPADSRSGPEAFRVSAWVTR